MRFAVGAFIILHGLVHAMYVGQALQWFELRVGMAWPIGAQFLPSGISDGVLRTSTAISIGIASAALVAGGVGVLLDAGWGGSVTVASAIVVSLLHVLLWDGDMKTSPDQGLYGIIINVVIVAWIVAAR
jgi:hypothetical protein